MPYVPELGMRVRDPREAAQEGAQAGQMFAQAFRDARNLDLDERKLKMMEADTAAKAKALQLRQIGLDELKASVEAGQPFEDAFFNASPKLFFDKPEVIGSIIQNQAARKARESYQETLTKGRDAALLEKKRHDMAMESKSNESPELRRAREEADLLSKVAPGVIDPAKKDAMVLGAFQKESNLKAARESRLEDAEKRKSQTLDAATRMEINAIGARIKKLQEAHDSIESETSGVGPRPNQIKRMKLNAEIAGLKEQARVLANGVKPADTTTEAAAPASEPSAAPSGEQGSKLRLGTVVEQGGKKFRYQGGDVGDPSSYVEVK